MLDQKTFNQTFFLEAFISSQSVFHHILSQRRAGILLDARNKNHRFVSKKKMHQFENSTSDTAHTQPLNSPRISFSDPNNLIIIIPFMESIMIAAEYANFAFCISSFNIFSADFTWGYASLRNNLP